MGLDNSALAVLCAAKSSGVEFTRTVTIGRQSLLPHPERALLQQIFGVLSLDEDAERFLKANSWGEALFRLLGAQDIPALDYSNYEGATLIHDLNLPIPDEFKERFTVVFDAGTLEHIFNATQAFKSCMEMVQVGGHFVQVNLANNYCGHGFWQFSPELLFRMFSPQNGFEVKAVLLHEVTRRGGWYLVTDPQQMHRRVELCNSKPTYIATIAQKVANVPVFATPPQQSDYVEAWESFDHEPASSSLIDSSPLPVRILKRAVGWRYFPPASKEGLRVLGKHAKSLLRPTAAGFAQHCYRRISEEDLLRGQFGPKSP